MEIEQMYLVGDFSVDTNGIFTDLPRNASRYSGGFTICEPKKSITLEKLNRQGFPFFSGDITVKKTFVANGDDTSLSFNKFGVNVVKAKINGKEIASFMYEPYCADVSDIVKNGENEIELTLVNNLRNLLGPFHLAEGESYSVGPGSFYKENCIWYRGAADGRWNDDYCFADISIFNRK